MKKDEIIEILEEVNKGLKKTIDKIDDYLNRDIIEFPIVGILCPVCHEKVALEHSNRIYLSFICRCGERFFLSQSNYKEINYINVRL